MNSKNIIILLFVCFLISCASDGQKKEKTSLEFQNIKGKVFSIKENSFELVSEFGKIVKEKEIVSDSSYQEYTPKGNISLAQMNDNKIIFEYDSLDRLIKRFTYTSHQNLDSYSLYFYDEFSNEIENIYFDSANNIIEINRYVYDKYKNRLEQKSFDQNNNLQMVIKNNYDFAGNLLAEDFYTPEGKKYLSFSYTYNAEGNLVTKSSEKKSPETFDYDKFGNQIKHKYEFGGSIDTIYDGDRYFSHTHEIVGKKMEYIYSYEFDHYNNWVKKIETENGVPTRMTERFITYYKQ